MKKLLLFVVISSLVNARTPDTLWSKTLDFEGNNIPYNVISTSDNNYLTVGVSFNYIDNGDAILLIKFDEDGNILWSNHYNFIYQDEWWFPNVVEINGIYYVCSRNVIFALDNNGELIWEKEYEDVWYFKGINKTENNEIILTGTEYTYFDGSNMIIVFKISTNGDVEWSYSSGWQSTAVGEDIFENSEGDYVIAGEHGGACQNQIYMKFDEIGNFLGSQQYGCWGYGNSITEKNNGGYLIGGNELRSINSSYGSVIWEKPYETFFAKQISDENILIAGINYLAKLDLEGNEIETFLISEIDSNYILVDIHYSHDYIIAVGTIDDSILLIKLNINLNIITIPQDFESIQEGINASIDGDTVLVSPGIYYENINFNGKNISVIGENRETTIIDGGQNGSVVTFWNNESNATLNGFTITNGNYDDGGGIYCRDNVTPLLENLIITENNVLQDGGGIFCYNYASPTIENVIILNNNASSDGGGLFASLDCTPSISNSIISNNSSENGGGIFTWGSEIIITNSIVIENSSERGGGLKIINSGPTGLGLSLSNSELIGNIASNTGGGIELNGVSNTIIKNVIIRENYGDNTGGIAILFGSNPQILNTLIENNTSNQNAGGAIHCWEGNAYIANTTIINNHSPIAAITSGNGGSPIIINSIIADNDGLAMWVQNSGSPYFSYSLFMNNELNSSYAGLGNIDADPLFTDPENGDFTLQPTSPCIDTGDPNSPLDPDGTIADIGAYYFSQITGCMDVNALNYNSEAHIEDNSCYYGINLSYGNNLVSFTGHPNIDSTALLLESIESQGANVNFIIGQGVGLFKTDDGWSGNLNTVDEKSAYWINVEGNLEWLLQFENGHSDICTDYDLQYGNNLISYLGVDNSNTIQSLGGQTISNLYGFIIGQSVGLFNTAGQWSGNLNNLNKNQGYWLNSYSTTPFRWGIGTDCDMPNSSFTKEEIVNKIHREYQFIQSTEQAFYLIKELIIDGKYPVAEDLILAYHNNILVGSTNYSELTVLPIMGRDMSEQTVGFIEAGQVPQLKLFKANGELIDLHADLEPFSNLLVSEVQTVTGSTIIIPNEYALHPAYPNPFNPVTNISFGLPMDTQVTLNIYDVEGRKVTTLTEGIRTAGNHTIEWNAENYPSGVYFVKLDAGNPSANSKHGFTQNQKLILLK